MAQEVTLPKSIAILKQMNVPSLPPTGIPMGTNTELPEGNPGEAFLRDIPYAKYLHPNEREKFMELSQQKQTRALLLDNMETLLLVGGHKILEGAGKIVSPLFKRMFPKTVKTASKIAKAMPINEKQSIQAAAIRMKDGTIYQGKTHHLAMEEFDKAGGSIRDWHNLVDDANGFVTNRGQFITRKDAVKLTGEASEDATDIIGRNIELPKYAGSINLQRQDIPVKLKLAELRVSEGLPKKKITWAETDAKSAEIMKDPVKIRESLEKLKMGKRLTEVDHDVARKANVEALYNFQKKVSTAKTPQEVTAITEAYKQQAFIPASEFANEAGRVLQGYNKEIGLNRLGKAFGKLERNLNPREMKAFKKLDLNDPAQVKVFENELGDPKVMDYVYEYWYNSILSGIPTHVVNVSSNTGWRMFQVPHRALTGFIDSIIGPIFRGGKRDVYMN